MVCCWDILVCSAKGSVTRRCIYYDDSSLSPAMHISQLIIQMYNYYASVFW